MGDIVAISDLWDVGQAAKYLRLSPTTVYRLARRDVLPSAMVGGQRRFSHRALERWVDERMRGGDEPEPGPDESGGG